MRRFIIANWKANPDTLAEAVGLFKFAANLPHKDEVEVIICPPAVWLSPLAQLGRPVLLGAQNAYFENHGAFTGEIGINMLKSLGVRYCLVGHSERRRLLGENDALVARKVLALQGAGLTPVLCVGSETMASGEAEKSRIRVQLDAVFKKLRPEASLMIAYEPVWAISTSGTGQAATPEYALEIVDFIRGLLPRNFKSETPVLYGGSVDKDNAAGFLSLKEIDGALVGGASLKPDHFGAIVNAAKI